MTPEPNEVKRALALCVELSTQIDTKDAVQARRAMERMQAWPLTPNLKILLGRMYALLWCIDISKAQDEPNSGHWVDFAESVAFLTGALLHYKNDSLSAECIDDVVTSYAEDIYIKATQ